MQAPPMEEMPPLDNRDRAQDLAYDAMRAPSAAAAAKFARQALELDPDCVDALLVLAQTEKLTPADYVERLREAVRAGERSLGPEIFEEGKGYFYGLLETRPYMRARFTLAETLWGLGQHEDATREWEAMLELNSGDNQGCRYRLMGCYLAAGNVEGADRLFQKYKGDWSAVFAWGLVVRRLLGGDTAGAAKAWTKAVKVNPHLIDLLTGRLRLPQHMPELVGMGDESEAFECLYLLGHAIMASEAAREWLLERAHRASRPR